MITKFRITDTIVQKRYDEVIALGTIVKGPFKVEGYDHYHVNWKWKEKPSTFEIMEQDLICIAPSKKYSYVKI